MATLLERLKPEYRKILETETKVKYPNSYQTLIKTLKKDYVMELTIEEAERIRTHLLGFSNTLDDIWSMFDDIDKYSELINTKTITNE